MRRFLCALLVLAMVASLAEAAGVRRFRQRERVRIVTPHHRAALTVAASYYNPIGALVAAPQAYALQETAGCYTAPTQAYTIPAPVVQERVIVRDTAAPSCYTAPAAVLAPAYYAAYSAPSAVVLRSSVYGYSPPVALGFRRARLGVASGGVALVGAAPAVQVNVGARRGLFGRIIVP